VENCALLPTSMYRKPSYRRCSFSEFDTVGSVRCHLVWNYGPLGRSRSSRAIDLDTDWKHYTTTDLRPISHRYRVITEYWSNYCFWQGVPIFDSIVQSENLNSGLQIWHHKTRNVTVSCSAQHISIQRTV